MLRELEIENYGLIAHACIAFAPGATIFTGETGSGKTMLLGALGFVLGNRAGPDVVRGGASKAIVALRFDADESLRERFARDGFELDPGEGAEVSREMTDGGRTSMRINGRTCTAAYVREISDLVAEIVGQHEARRLLAPAYHMNLLDAFAGSPALRAREAVAQAHAAVDERTAQLADRQRDDRRQSARYDDARYAVEEIESVRPEAGETESLRLRQRYAQNVQRISDALARAHDSLASDERGAILQLGASANALESIADLDSGFAAMAQAAAAVQSQANDLAAQIAGALDPDEVQAGQLDGINDRLDALQRLERKYGGSLPAVLAYAAAAREEVDAFQGRDRIEAELHAKLEAAQIERSAAAARLSALRASEAPKLSAAVQRELSDLALGSGRFEVGLRPVAPITSAGAERVEFTFAANAGEPPRSLDRVASGGELSRLLLGLIVVLSKARRDGGALVFDEIDTGIGGVTGTAVGARLGRLSRDAQVVCVTHLAQLATWADRHYVLEKTERRGTTSISVREVAGTQARAEELARMLSGEKHDVALKHARSLLAKSRS